ncbi:Mediator complex subunit Med13 [Penicillium odoratum]|uniref:Mediator complex subunit Med13 n=1 Tax=Penicillium odoratum TaxID=1167516 RepID=UPI002547619B|nr:Mediator complex subunit Med13 [Penicillium odoratum]KAJ5759259.1 Mediator complex subunit Med13 [Penicillium odoratum]
MDFPGSASTNVHLIDGFSTIYWRIYTEESGIANNQPEGQPNGYIILKHLSRLKDLEAKLRILNCLASCPRRLGLWVFSPTPDFESLDSLYVRDGNEASKRILVDATTLKVSASGSIASQDLVRSLSSDTQNQAGSQAGQQRPQQAQATPRRPESHSSSAAIYASFISAVTGAISLYMIRSHGAFPLGSRTLFTAVESVGYESPRVNNDSPFSKSCLTSLNVQLNAPGTLMISSQTISQVGISRLCGPRDDISDVLRVQPGTDIWLCPNGTVARLVTANTEPPTVPSPGIPVSGNLAAKKRQWKLDVVQWLVNFGLHIDSVDDEVWVEVEVWEPFFARLAGEAWRQSDEPQSALPLKRMLWPARFCFKRTPPQTQAQNNGTSWPLGLPEDPLDFAERWPSETDSLLANNHITPLPVIHEPPKNEDISSPKADNLDGFESLSRMAQYPDLPPTNLVYPTPPEGAATIGLQNANPSDGFPDYVDFQMTPGAPQDPANDHNSRLSPDVAIGSGRYDASDDEDLFGEMNERDFGSKGITDADFSFFDDPDFEMNDDSPNVPYQVPPHPVLEESKPEESVAVTSDLPVSAPPDASGLTQDVAPEEPTPNETKDENSAPVDESMCLESSQDASPDPESPPIISPPLSPVEVKKILFSGGKKEDPERPQETRTQQGHYHPVAFEKRLGNWSEKYGAAGKFWFASGGTLDASDLTPNSIPTIGLPHRGRSGANNSHAKFTSKNVPAITLDNDEGPADSDSETSDESDETSSEHAPTPMAVPSLKRKRVPSESDIQSVASPAKSTGVPDVNSGLKVENCTFLGNFLANFSDWSFIGYFSALQAQQLPVLVRREDQIPIAQLLVDQITQSSLDHQLGGHIGLFGLENESLTWRTYLEETNFLGQVAKLDLKTYASLQEEVTIAPVQQPPKDVPRGSILRLAAPHVRMRRGQEYLEVLPPAVSFWETFGLEPAHGSKDISAYCIHPYAASNAADTFLNRFGLHYDSCHLGSHTRGDKSISFENGLRSWDSESSSYVSMMQSLKSICEELGTDLSQYSPSTENCVVYIINPFPHAAALADICAAFWTLFQQIAADADRQQGQPVNEVALQIIPMDFIMSEDSMVVPTQTEYLNLALEVYSRCRPNNLDLSSLLGAPAILLADPLPKAINFRLAPDKGSPLQDGRSLHIAYSKSSDQRWLSVAWSDSSGSLQTSMSYCLRYRTRGTARPIAEVRNEIWATTRHILEKFQAQWKVILVNSEPIDSEEVEAWTNMAEQQNKLRPASMELIIMTVNTVPDLVLEPNISHMTPSILNTHFSSTPVSTPNPSVSIASPEQTGNAPTPSAPYNALTPTELSLEPDSDVVLTDILDESWAVTLSHRLNTSPHVTEFRPALASGYLLRRKGTTDGDGVFTMTANLIHSQRPASSHEPLLKDILGMYRDLASLARARGMRSVHGNTLPWHIATALRAQELLSYVF